VVVVVGMLPWYDSSSFLGSADCADDNDSDGVMRLMMKETSLFLPWTVWVMLTNDDDDDDGMIISPNVVRHVIPPPHVPNVQSYRYPLQYWRVIATMSSPMVWVVVMMMMMTMMMDGWMMRG